MKFRALKYSLSYVIPAGVAVSFLSEGWLSFFGIIEAFVFIPLFELLVKPSPKNLEEIQKEVVRNDKLHDWILYLTPPIQYGFLLLFLYIIPNVTLFSVDFWGKVTAFGLLCGVIGINVAHELGHRKSKADKFLAKLLLLSSLYMHFFIEHNYGHHKNVATRKDPASARYNEPLYFFWIRSVLFSYISAWKIENKRLQKKEGTALNWKNEMIWFTLIQLGLLALIFFSFGVIALWAFIAAALIGALLLETVNYIEHYGLERLKVTEKRFEDVKPTHSWNSDHVLGRTILFELTRHSDHHANPYRKYQVLEHFEESPQLPTGYPGMMLLAFIPPLWFWVMNPRLLKSEIR